MAFLFPKAHYLILLNILQEKVGLWCFIPFEMIVINWRIFFALQITFLSPPLFYLFGPLNGFRGVIDAFLIIFSQCVSTAKWKFLGSGDTLWCSVRPVGRLFYPLFYLILFFVRVID